MLPETVSPVITSWGSTTPTSTMGGFWALAMAGRNKREITNSASLRCAKPARIADAAIICPLAAVVTNSGMKRIMLPLPAAVSLRNNDAEAKGHVDQRDHDRHVE